MNADDLIDQAGELLLGLWIEVMTERVVFPLGLLEMMKTLDEGIYEYQVANGEAPIDDPDAEPARRQGWEHVFANARKDDAA